MAQNSSKKVIAGRGSREFGLRIMATLVLLINLSILPTWAASQETKPSEGIGLTAAERQWMDEQPLIRVTPDPAFPPYEFFDVDGRFRGIGADFISLIAKKSGLKFDIIRVKDWSESVKRTKARENDVWSVAAQTPERSAYMTFTSPYIESPAIILVRSDTEKELSIEDLKGLRVAVSSGYAVHEHLSRRFPDLSLDAVPNPLDGLKKLSFGQADAMVINVALASYLMEKHGISNLRLAGDAGFTYRWGLAVRSDWPELHSIVEKGLAEITQEERQEIIRKWVALKEQPTRITRTQIFAALGILTLILIIAVLIWNRSLRRQVELKTKVVEAELAERRAAENALQKSEYILTTAIASISDGFVMTDGEDRFVLTNRRFRNLYPNSLDLIRPGEKFEDFLRGSAERGEISNLPDQIDGWLKERMAALGDGTAVFEDELIGGRWVRSASRSLPDGGHVGIHVDITEVKEAQIKLGKLNDELQELNEIKNQFMGMAAHDLRNPIGAIQGMSKLIMELSLDAEKKDELISSINKTSGQMLVLLNDLLDISAIESGQFEINWEKGNLSKLLSERIDLAAMAAQNKEIEISTKIEDDPTLEFDRERISQAIDNLLSNAVKFSQPGSTVETSIRSDESVIVFQVKDHGQGIKPEEIDRVFNSFERLSTKPTAGEKSTGLGLAIVKKIIDAHGGEIWVESKFGEGAVFSFSLPLERQTDA